MKECVTGQSKYGSCVCCGKNGVECCAECEESCNARCGWIEEPQSSEPAEPVIDAEIPATEEAEPANDAGTPEGEPCEWENASGGEEDEAEETPEPEIPAGESVSLRDAAFDSLIDAMDSKINQALRTAVGEHQSFTLTAKVTFSWRSGVFDVEHETGYQFDPIKVKSKGVLFDPIQIALDDTGRPIIPYDREHQLTFSEVQPIRTTVDGETGLVEQVEADVSDEEPEEPFDTDSCSLDCPFLDLDEDDRAYICCYGADEFEPEAYRQAVEECGCTRPGVRNTYNALFKEDADHE